MFEVAALGDVTSKVANPLLKKYGGLLIDRIVKKFNEIRSEKEADELLNSLSFPDSNNDNRKEELARIFRNRYLSFKSILSNGSNIYVDDVYVSPELRDVSQGCLVDDISSEYKKNNVLVLVGKAGQGKTTFVRNLMDFEVRREGGCFPVMVKLRDIDFEQSDSLFDIISYELGSISIGVTSELVFWLINKNKLLICFDGFDEVEVKYRRQALRLIEEVRRNESFCIVTSRPGTEITSQDGAYFNYELCDLNRDLVNEMISKASIVDDESKRSFITHLEGNEEVYNVLKTPILLDIYMSTFYQVEIIPKNEVQFYQSLFHALVVKHDRLKNLVRETSSGLDVDQLYRVFLRVSFDVVFNQRNYSFPEVELDEIFNKSVEKLGYETSGCLTRLDVVNRSSLIVEDGLYFSYIHKTVVEYHAAKFFFKRTKGFKEEYYGVMIRRYDPIWNNFLRYLFLIDSICFKELFLMPLLKRCLEDRVGASRLVAANITGDGSVMGAAIDHCWMALQACVDIMGWSSFKSSDFWLVRSRSRYEILIDSKSTKKERSDALKKCHINLMLTIVESWLSRNLSLIEADVLREVERHKTIEEF